VCFVSYQAEEQNTLPQRGTDNHAENCQNAFGQGKASTKVTSTTNIGYHVDSSNDLLYNERFAYDGLPNVVSLNLT